MINSDLLGKRAGNVRVTGVLGQGGMASVYVGYDEKLGRRVALKAILGERRLDPAMRARFQREARALSQLDHPNICRIYGYVESDESDFLALELIDGRDLRDVIRERKATLDHRLGLAEQIASALAAAHERAIVHRDIKPANVMVTRDGVAKVLDFGLARTGVDENAPTLAGPPGEGDGSALSNDDESSYLVTRLGTIVGTLAYMSPEQARGEPVTTSSDMYSFGLLLQELVTGEAPVDACSPPEELLQQAREGRSRVLAGVDADLTALVNRLKAAAPARRPSALDTVERLRWIRSAHSRRRRRILVTGGYAILSVLVVALAFASWRATREAARANAEAVRANREAAYNAESWLRHVEKLAEFQSMVLQWAIINKDRPLVAQFLEVLGADDRMRAACVYDQGAEVLGEYQRRAQRTLCPPYKDVMDSGHRIVDDRLEVWRPVMVHDQSARGGGRQIGSVFLAADKDYTAPGR